MNRSKDAHSDIHEKQAQEFVEQYMEKLFYFCLRKTGNSYEAEDLTQEIALQILTALQGGVETRNFSAWVWQIARNRYSMWADRKHKRGEHELDCTPEDYEVEDESERLSEIVIHNENLSTLRRELAFIRSDYRDIVVTYYIDGKSLRQIAEGLSLPESAVKQRLYRARNLLKEGMDMAREFGVRSYNPERITYANICKVPGKRGQPWMLNEPKLNQNIFAAAYGTPQSAEALSIEMGVALPYMEDTLEFLTRETLLRKINGKYETAFPIISKNAQQKMLHCFSKIMESMIPVMEEGIDRLMEQYREAGLSFYGDFQGYEDAKWVLLLQIYDGYLQLYEPEKGLGDTQRPDDGIWDLVGFEETDFSSKVVGNHGHRHGFSQYRISYAGIEDWTPSYLSDEENEVLYDAVQGNSIRNIPCAETLVQYGYLCRKGTDYIPMVTVMRISEMKKFVKYGKRKHFSPGFMAHAEARGRLNQKILALIEMMEKTVEEILYDDLPPSMQNQEGLLDALTHSMCRYHYALACVIEQAVDDGWLVCDDKTGRAIGAYFLIP